MNAARKLICSTGESTVSELTAGGRGAICVLGVSGTEVASKLQRFFLPASGKPITSCPAMKPLYGQWKSEGIIVCVHDPAYVEVHCHGGDFAKQRIINDLDSLGFVYKGLVQLQHPTSSVDAAMLELAKATTQKTAAVLTWQTEGAFEKALEEIDGLVASNAVADALARIEAILKLDSLGRHLTRPWKVAVAGAVNAGKSSLINRIVGYGRTIVFEEPGTTRDLVSVETAVNGWPIELTDTAGFRESNDPIEQQGIALAKEAVANADLVLEVIDVTCPELHTGLHGVSDHSSHRLTVLNKCDVQKPQSGLEGIQVSALTGQGVDELLDLISQTLVPLEPGLGSAVPFLDSQVRALQELRDALNSA